MKTIIVMVALLGAFEDEDACRAALPAVEDVFRGTATIQCMEATYPVLRPRARPLPPLPDYPADWPRPVAREDVWQSSVMWGRE